MVSRRTVTGLGMVCSLAFASACGNIPGPVSPQTLAGDWRLVSYVSPTDSADVPPTPTPPIIHVTASGNSVGRMAGTDGCNEWMGEFSLPAEGAIAVGPLARTLKSCIRIFTLAEGGYAGEELNNVTQYTRSGSTLVLSSDDKRTRVTLAL
jgi:heat shock protein HslJ